MAALAGMMTLAGCNNQDEPGTGNRPLQGTPIRVTTQVTEPETRTEMTKEDLTEFYFRVTGENGATGIYNHFTKMTLGDGGEWVAESGETTWGGCHRPSECRGAEDDGRKPAAMDVSRL